MCCNFIVKFAYEIFKIVYDACQKSFKYSCQHNVLIIACLAICTVMYTLDYNRFSMFLLEEGATNGTSEHVLGWHSVFPHQFCYGVPVLLVNIFALLIEGHGICCSLLKTCTCTFVTKIRMPKNLVIL
jgi:hypothetical protein